MSNLLTRREVESRLGLTKSTIYRLMRSGLFPEPIRVGPRAVRWPEVEIEQWLASGRGPTATESTSSKRDSDYR